MSGFEHHAVERAEWIQYAGRLVPVVTAEDLLLLKLLASRPRDQEDAIQILLRHGSQLDWHYVNTTAEELDEALAGDMSERLQAIRSEYAAWNDFSNLHVPNTA